MKYINSAIVVVVGFYALCCLVNYVAAKGEQADYKSNLDAVVLNCLPRDTTEQTIFTIARRKDGEYLNCERHKRVIYAHANKGKTYRLHLAMGDQND